MRCRVGQGTIRTYYDRAVASSILGTQIFFSFFISTRSWPSLTHEKCAVTSNMAGLGMPVYIVQHGSGSARRHQLPGLHVHCLEWVGLFYLADHKELGCPATPTPLSQKKTGMCCQPHPPEADPGILTANSASSTSPASSTTFYPLQEGPVSQDENALSGHALDYVTRRFAYYGGRNQQDQFPYD